VKIRARRTYKDIKVDTNICGVLRGKQMNFESVANERKEKMVRDIH
jgi:hypothetical protein